MPKHADLSVGHIRNYVPVTPNNSTDNLKADPSDIVIGLYIGGTAGNIEVTVDGVDKIIPVPAFFYWSCTGVSRVKATSTTATPIFACVI